MTDNLIVLHAAVAVVGVVVAIVGLRIEALVALTAGALYLGLATGLGLAGTLDTIASGFGEIMAEVGLLIAFGVLLGSLLAATGALERLTQALLRVVRPARCQYVFGASACSVFSAIYGDVMLVLTTPLGRSVARRTPNGMAAMGSAIALGPLVGTLMVVPGTAALALAGLLDVPLGEMLLVGLFLAVPTTLVTLFLMQMLATRTRYWNPERDELDQAEAPDTIPDQAPRRTMPLWLLLTPFLLALGLIAAGGVARATGHESAVIEFLSNGIMALFLALLLAYLLAWRALSGEVMQAAFSKGMRDIGPILAITGIGGSLGSVISNSGLADILADFSPRTLRSRSCWCGPSPRCCTWPSGRSRSGQSPPSLSSRR